MGMFDHDDQEFISGTLDFKESESQLRELIRIGQGYTNTPEGLANYLVCHNVRVLK